MADKVANPRKSSALRTCAASRELNSAQLHTTAGYERHTRYGERRALPPEALTVREVGGYLGVSDDIVRHLIRTQKLEAAKIGGHWRIRPADLADYIMRMFERPP